MFSECAVNLTFLYYWNEIGEAAVGERERDEDRVSERENWDDRDEIRWEKFINITISLSRTHSPLSCLMQTEKGIDKNEREKKITKTFSQLFFSSPMTFFLCRSLYRVRVREFGANNWRTNRTFETFFFSLSKVKKFKKLWQVPTQYFAPAFWHNF
jgi:hypothetical protein